MTNLGIDIMPSSVETAQFIASDVEQLTDISSCSIHVERIIQRIKSFNIFDGKLRQTQKHVAEQIF